MAAARSLSKATLLALSVLAILSLHGAESQTTANNTTTDRVPGWGVAIIVLVSILLALALLTTCIVPICLKRGCGGCSMGN